MSLGSTHALLERDAALDEIASALDETEGERGSAVFVMGTAGIGKTSVLSWAGARWLEKGHRLATATGSPMETALPFGFIGQAIGSLDARHVGDFVATELVGGPSTRYYRTFQWLEEVTRDEPVLLLLDDLHWSDTDSLELIGFVCRRLGSMRIGVLGSLRPEPDLASSLANDLVASSAARLVELHPLSQGASSTLLMTLCMSSITEDDAESLWRACAGTPLLLESAAIELNSGASPKDLSTGDRSTGLARPFLVERFAGLGHDALTFVKAAAIFGVRFRPEYVMAIGDVRSDPEETLRKLDRAGIVEDLGAGWARFIHPLFAQAALDVQSLSEREPLHAKAFRLLVDRDEPKATAAEHAYAAHLYGDTLAIETTVLAGREAMSRDALLSAVTLFGHAVELSGADAPVSLLMEHASSLMALGFADEARTILAALFDRTDLDDLTRAQVGRLLAHAAAISSRADEAQTLYEQAADLATSDPHLAAEILLDAALDTVVFVPSYWAAQVASRGLTLVDKNDPLHDQLAAVLDYTRHIGGDPESGQALVTSALEAMKDSSSAEAGWGWGMSLHAMNIAKNLEQVDDAAALFSFEFDRASRAGAPVLMQALAIAYADMLHRVGRVDEALEMFKEAEERSQAPMPWSHLAYAALLKELGQDDEARPHVEAIRSFVDPNRPELLGVMSLWLAIFDARDSMLRGEAEVASETMARAREIAVASGFIEPCAVPWLSTAFDAHFAAGRLDRVDTLIDNYRDPVAEYRCRWPSAVLALAFARKTAVLGETDPEPLFAQALEIFAKIPYPIANAEALLAYGDWLRRSGRPRDARAPLGHALELAETAHSVRLDRSVGSALSAAGGRRRRAPSDTPTGLTPQESRVAGLAATGLTTARIASALHLSTRTVEHHLTSIYTKLGIRSRRDLMRRHDEFEIH